MSSMSSIVIDKKKVKNPPLDVVQLGDKMLRQPAKRVTKIDEELRETVRQMLQTMYSQDGIGLAAPQVGINKLSQPWPVPRPREARGAYRG